MYPSFGDTVSVTEPPAATSQSEGVTDPWPLCSAWMTYIPGSTSVFMSQSSMFMSAVTSPTTNVSDGGTSFPLILMSTNLYPSARVKVNVTDVPGTTDMVPPGVSVPHSYVLETSPIPPVTMIPITSVIETSTSTSTSSEDASRKSMNISRSRSMNTFRLLVRPTGSPSTVMP